MGAGINFKTRASFFVFFCTTPTPTGKAIRKRQSDRQIALLYTCCEQFSNLDSRLFRMPGKEELSHLIDRYRCVTLLISINSLGILILILIIITNNPERKFWKASIQVVCSRFANKHLFFVVFFFFFASHITFLYKKFEKFDRPNEARLRNCWNEIFKSKRRSCWSLRLSSNRTPGARRQSNYFYFF